MAKNGTQKKVENLYALLAKLAKGEEVYPQNVRTQEELEVDERTLRRYLNEICKRYSHIVLPVKKQLERDGRKVTVYRVVDKKRDVSEVFRFFIESGDDLGWLLQLVYDNDPSLLRDSPEDAKAAFSSSLKADEGVFRFVGSPFENLDNPRMKELFKVLRIAVKNHEYRNIEYRYKEPETLKNLKCLKLLHMNDNWYLAVETEEREFRFLRLAFIEKVRYSKKSNYQQKVLEKYSDFFQHVQNAMTLNAPFKTARLVASARVALYFEPHMKPLFPSQEFKRKHEDGSIEFSVRYTQPMEILPFIKQWQPDLVIMEPKELRDALKDDLFAALANYR